MSDFMGIEYNYDVWEHRPDKGAHFKEIIHAGTPAPDFTLRTLDGQEVTLSSLRGKPVVIEFGSIT